MFVKNVIQLESLGVLNFFERYFDKRDQRFQFRMNYSAEQVFHYLEYRCWKRFLPKYTETSSSKKMARFINLRFS